ncbi:hypothetical protein HB162lentus_28000 [Mammaliicoccus lentus]
MFLLANSCRFIVIVRNKFADFSPKLVECVFFEEKNRYKEHLALASL